MMTRCTWDGCRATTKQPFTDHWSYLLGWGHGVEDGHYCRAHADALETVLMENGGTLDNLDGEFDQLDEYDQEEPAEPGELIELAGRLITTQKEYDEYDD